MANGIIPEKRHGQGKFFVTGAIRICLALACSQLPFEVLVGSIYPYTGYLGLFIIFCIIINKL